MKRFLDAVYLITSFLGATIIALNINANLIGYSLFLVSSCTGAYLVLKSNASRSLLIVNIMFGCINLLGIIRA